MKITENNRLYVWIGILLGIGIFTGLILNTQIFPDFDVNEENDFPNWITLLIEIIIGVGIALVVYDHTKKIETREGEDLQLAIRGTYYSLWNLYQSMFPYSRSEEVRSHTISGLQILSVVQTVRSTLSKCAQSIDSVKIETLQVDLLEIQEIIRSSIDPRANVEKLWSANKNRFMNAMDEIKEISREDFEPLIPETSRAEWSVDS